MKCKELLIHRSSNGMHYVALPTLLADEVLNKFGKRVKVIIDDLHTIHAKVMTNGTGSHFIYVGNKLLRELGRNEGDVLSVEIFPDESAYQFDMPDQLKAVLDTDPEAAKVFDQLRPGTQRSLMYLITRVKSDQKRIERSLRIAERIKSGFTNPRTILK